MEKFQQAVDKVNETFRTEYSSFRAEITCIDKKEVNIEIEGDWKHDHIFADNIMQENGFTKTNEYITHPTDEDWYESTHFYTFKG